MPDLSRVAAVRTVHAYALKHGKPWVEPATCGIYFPTHHTLCGKWTARPAEISEDSAVVNCERCIDHLVNLMEMRFHLGLFPCPECGTMAAPQSYRSCGTCGGTGLVKR